MVQLAKLSSVDLVPFVGQISGHPLAKALTRFRQGYLLKIADNISTIVCGPRVAGKLAAKS